VKTGLDDVGWRVDKVVVVMGCDGEVAVGAKVEEATAGCPGRCLGFTSVKVVGVDLNPGL